MYEAVEMSQVLSTIACMQLKLPFTQNSHCGVYEVNFSSLNAP